MSCAKPLLTALLLLLAVPSGAGAQSRAEIALAKKVLAAAQRLSIRRNVEYCGYIGLDASGRLVASRATRGDEASCLAPEPANIRVITASYHTHGAFSRDYFGEMPSGEDMEGDEAMGIDGFVATPGGRLWYVDTTDMIARQLCGIGCLPRDARFRAGVDGVIAQSYSYRQLVHRLSE